MLGPDAIPTQVSILSTSYKYLMHSARKYTDPLCPARWRTYLLSQLLAFFLCSPSYLKSFPQHQLDAIFHNRKNETGAYFPG